MLWRAPFFQTRRENSMGNVNMEASQINYRGGEKKMSVEEALKSTAGEAAAIAQLQTDVANLNGTKANQMTIAPFFNPEASYEVGDIVYYNGLSYRCTNEHEGEWDADDFAATTISGELDALKSGLNNLTSLVTLGVIPTANNNYTLSQYSYGKAKGGIITLFLDITCQTPNTSDFVDIGYIDNTNLIASYGATIGEVNGGDNITIQLETDGKIKAIYGTASKEYRGLATIVN